jgi:predicted nucleic acid-binding protein
VKIAIDTSVLVAAQVAAHPQHVHAGNWMSALNRSDLSAIVTVHALAEVWSVLTKIPVTPRIDPTVARTVIMQIASVVQVVQLTEALYFEAFERCAARDLRSGAVFDALHLVAAEQMAADLILTLNVKDFLRLAKPSTPRILPPHGPDAEAVLSNIR